MTAKPVRVVGKYSVAPLLRICAHVGVRPLLPLLYDFDIVEVDPRIYDLTDGAVVAATHTSYADAPALINLAKHVTRMRPVTKHGEYKKWRWVMAAFDAIPTTPGGRLHRGQHTLDIQRKVLQAGRTVLIFPSGKIDATGVTRIHPEKSVGVYHMLTGCADNPKPLIMVRTKGMGANEERLPGSRLWRRRVEIRVSLFWPDLSIGLAALNKAMEDHLNFGTPIPEVVTKAVHAQRA